MSELPHIDTSAPARRSSQRRKKMPAWVWSTLWITLTGVLIWGRQKSASDTGDEIDAYLMAQQFVEDQLVSPGSADFPWMGTADVRVERRGEVWVVESYVDSQNRFGAMLRSHFTCKLRYVGDDEWRCESLTFR